MPIVCKHAGNIMKQMLVNFNGLMFSSAEDDQLLTLRISQFTLCWGYLRIQEHPLPLQNHQDKKCPVVLLESHQFHVTYFPVRYISTCMMMVPSHNL